MAWHLRGFGCDPLLVSAVGTDDAGDEVLRRMSAWGMRTDGVARIPDRPTGRVLVTLEGGEPRYEIPPGQAWDRIPHFPVDQGPGSEPALVYHGTLALREAHNRQLLQRRMAGGAGRAYVDVNLRAPWWTHEEVMGSLAGATWAAARSRGVFVNPALVEPFGLTLLEAAASGLPVVATNDGGPQDIIGACSNGLLVDPRDPERMGEAIAEALASPSRWEDWSRSGLAGVHRTFTWTRHAAALLDALGAAHPDDVATPPRRAVDGPPTERPVG